MQLGGVYRTRPPFYLPSQYLSMAQVDTRRYAILRVANTRCKAALGPIGMLRRGMSLVAGLQHSASQGYVLG